MSEWLLHSGISDVHQHINLKNTAPSRSQVYLFGAVIVLDRRLVLTAGCTALGSAAFAAADLPDLDLG